MRPLAFNVVVIILSTMGLLGVTFLTNSDQVDVAIAIHYGVTTVAKKADVYGLLKVLDDVVEKMPIGENAARIAVMEFGPTAKVHLPIEEGTTAPNVLYGIEFIGEQTFTQKIPISREDAAKQTRQLVFPPNSTDRVQVPKLVLLVSVATRKEISDSKQDNMTMYMDFARRFGQYGAHILYLDTYADTFNSKVNDTWNLKYRIGLYGNRTFLIYYDVEMETRHPSLTTNLMNHVAYSTKFCLESCGYIKQVGHKCYFDQHGACVADVAYVPEVDRDFPSHGAPPNATEEMVRLVHMYCLQNGSTDPCPRADQCDSDQEKYDRVGT